MSEKVRVGFIGSGGIAGTHIKYLKLVKDVEVIALSDVSQAAMDARIKEHQLQDVKTFTDYKPMLKMKEIDAVSVCTPNFLHYRPTIDALRAGKHVIVEKPMAMNAREAKAMCDAAKKAKKVLTIGFQQRFNPGTGFLRRAVEEGKLGDIVYVRAQALRRRGIPSWGVPKPVAASANCYTYLGNKKPEATAPWGDWDYKTYTVEDLAIGLVRFDNGATLVIEASFAAHMEDNDIFKTTLMGTKAGASWGGGPPRIFTDYCGKMVNIEPKALEKEDGFAVKMRSWIESIHGAPNPAPGEDGLAVQQILDALYLSSEKGHEVAIK